MPEEEPGKDRTGSADGAIKTDIQCPFGPEFFIKWLRGFVLEQCPLPSEGLPVLEIHLRNGDILSICHIIGLAPLWLVFAVHETDKRSGNPPMRTEIIPYEMIDRITIRTTRVASGQVGFNPRHDTSWIGESVPLSPKEALIRAAQL